MKKFRVIKVTKSPPYLYQPQVKMLWWWRNFMAISGGHIFYRENVENSEDAALSHIIRYVSYKRIKNHKVIR